MEIQNKKAFKAKLKVEVVKHIRQFPFYFYGNIVINLVLLVSIVAVALFIVLTLGRTDGRAGDIFAYGMLFLVFLMSAFSITIRSFFKSIRILNAIQAGHYDVDIEDYELDHVLQFFEQLPMSKEEVERVKVGLSFGKLINVLDLFGIIVCEGETYDIDLIFKHRAENEIEEESRGNSLEIKSS